MSALRTLFQHAFFHQATNPEENIGTCMYCDQPVIRCEGSAESDFFVRHTRCRRLVQKHKRQTNLSGAMCLNLYKSVRVASVLDRPIFELITRMPDPVTPEDAFRFFHSVTQVINRTPHLRAEERFQLRHEVAQLKQRLLATCV